MKPIRAISIRQPMAEMILRGIKKYEYRTTNFKLRERVYIFASVAPKDYPRVGEHGFLIDEFVAYVKEYY
ncbi:hypothetical protein BH09BAC3_BH09BAC3_38260 [soil metagenome]